MIHDRIELVDVDAKPEINAIGRYFVNRLRPTVGHDVGTQPISISHDEFDNTLYTSNLHVERTLNGDHPSVLAVSAEGKELVHGNPGLLGRIAAGDFETQFIGGGGEGRVYKITLDTAQGKKSFALKYTFPIGSGGKLGITDVFTPGVDQMRALQLAQRENPVPGVTYAVPIIASIDMTLAPYIQDSMDVYLRGKENMLSAEAKEQFRSMVGRRTLGEMSSPFLNAFNSSANRTLTKLDNWYKQGNTISFVSKNLSFDDISMSPFLVRIPLLYELHQEYLADPTLIGNDQRERLDVAAAKCLVANELLVGL